MERPILTDLIQSSTIPTARFHTVAFRLPSQKLYGEERLMNTFVHTSKRDITFFPRHTRQACFKRLLFSPVAVSCSACSMRLGEKKIKSGERKRFVSPNLPQKPPLLVKHFQLRIRNAGPNGHKMIAHFGSRIRQSPKSEALLIDNYLGYIYVKALGSSGD